MNPRPQVPGRVLLVRLSHLGDVVHALPVYHALRAAYPQAELGWAVQPEFSDLVAGLPGSPRVFPFHRRGGWRAWPRLRRALRGFAPDLAVDAQGNLKSAAVTFASGAPHRTGLARDDWREPFGARVLNDPAPPTAGAVHALDRMCALARHVGRAGEDLRFDPGLTDAEREAGERALAAQLPDGSDGDALLHLAPRHDVRAWSARRCEELARALAASGRRTLVLAGPREADVGLELERALADVPAARVWIDQRGLRALAAVFAAAAASEMKLVACDSGPLHLAVACGLESVALAGPQDPCRTGPWTAPDGAVAHTALRAPDAPTCAPCLRRSCEHEDGPVCMERIEAELVVRALDGARAPACVS